MSHDHITEKLIRMANQIATFFKSQPEDERLAGIATHINKFWEPRMRRQFFELMDAGAEGFDPLVIEAAALIRRPEASDHSVGLTG
jgi:formate dehydrogenase subunit delta